MNSMEKAWTKQEGITWQNFGDGVVIFAPLNHEIHELDSTSGWLWEHTANTSGEELAIGLRQEFQYPIAKARKDVEVFLEKVNYLGLVK